MPVTQTPPGIDKTAFSCPHCGALAHQTWYDVFAEDIGEDKTPNLISEEHKNNIADDIDEETRRRIFDFIDRLATKQIFLDRRSQSKHADYDVHNIWISKCFSCRKPSVWIYDKILWPSQSYGPAPNPDMPDEVFADYNEAATILNLSPRGAAALLRLCIQKLCKVLGESGQNTNDDIGSLVKKGLDLRIQQALDVVRVVGNNAVHPGQIDLKDDRSTAAKLFDLVNLIADSMISQPKHIQTMFDGLPQGAKDQIASRDRKKP